MSQEKLYTKAIWHFVLIMFTVAGCKNQDVPERLRQRSPNFDQVKSDLEFKARYKGGRKAFEKFAKNQSQCVKELYPKLTTPVNACITVNPNGKPKELYLTPAENFSSDSIINIMCWNKFMKDTNWIDCSNKKNDFYFCLPIWTCAYYDCP
jgi:hypothetical protein